MNPARLSSMDRYRAMLGNRQPLAAKEELELARKWREQGDQRAGKRLIEASLPFVIKVAREYRRWGMPLEDLVQQGNLGLLRAAKKFDPEKSCRLVTYAAYWIRAEIREYVVRYYRIVRLGTTRTERKAMRAFRKQVVESPQQLAEISGMPAARAEKLWPLLQQSDMSLDASFDDWGPAIDRFADHRSSPEDVVDRERTVAGVREVMEQALNTLTDRERMIVKARILADTPSTLSELGRKLGVSKERVRQLELRARRKLREQLAEFAPAA
ncbi:MAG: sigma-70 family RNA polymerase sigma factor [Myxococcota bacterium]